MPTASTLFLIYTETLNLQGFASTMTNENRLQSQRKDIIDSAVAVIRAETELVLPMQIIESATSDRIDLQEANCVHELSRQNR